MNRTVFIIDGFNLYHSVREAARVLGGKGTKWLNIHALCDSYLHLIGRGATLEKVYYFSALAKHLESSDPDVTRRHRTLLRALENSGVVVELARFKKKTTKCDHCSKKIVRREEKETDVALAARLFECFHTDECDTAVIMSGDTDIAPAVRTAQRLFPDKEIAFAFPFGRKNKELTKLVKTSFQMTKEQYRKHQFPESIEISGRIIHKPTDW
jgi:uncharacterized LabA/DUF88 family protein